MPSASRPSRTRSSRTVLPPGGQNETCATYNLLKLSRQLFHVSVPDGKYMDYYEQALYNHILASVAEDDPGNTYHVPLNPGSRKQFGNATMDGIHLLQWHSHRKQHQAPGFDLFQRALTTKVCT